MARQLYLGHDKMMAGVCSGIADYFGWNTTIVRIAAVLLLLGRGGLIAYIVAMIVMRERPDSVDDL
ncbi:MAG: PspC domain-containing protein [Spirochaetaceae bacterium]|nr:MAG: PspC domain-containing protein [Spirochaetaceae bacterium]